jgi:hypothetical protein
MLHNAATSCVQNFQLLFNASFRGQSRLMQLNAVIFSKLAFASKQDDFTEPELDFSAFADANGVVGKFYSNL